MLLLYFILFHVYNGLIWSGTDDLSLVLPDETNLGQFYVIRAYNDQTVHVDTFDESNTISAVTLDTHTDVTVNQAVLVNYKAYFLTESNTLVVFNEGILQSVGHNVTTNFGTETKWNMMAFPHKVTTESDYHRFLVFLNTTSPTHQELYIGMVENINDELKLTSLELNSTFDLSNAGHDDFTATISITQVAVNLVMASGTINSDNDVDLSMYKTRTTDASEISDIIDDVSSSTSYSLKTSGSSSIGLSVSQGVTGGMFIYSKRSALYSLYDGDYAEEIIDQSTNGKFRFAIS